MHLGLTCGCGHWELCGAGTPKRFTPSLKPWQSGLKGQAQLRQWDGWASLSCCILSQNLPFSTWRKFSRLHRKKTDWQFQKGHHLESPVSPNPGSFSPLWVPSTPCRWPATESLDSRDKLHYVKAPQRIPMQLIRVSASGNLRSPPLLCRRGGLAAG